MLVSVSSRGARRFGFPLSISVWLTLLYAFGTPVFFRTAALSLNLLVALLGLFAFAVMWVSPDPPAREFRQRYVLAGLIAGYTSSPSCSVRAPLVPVERETGLVVCLGDCSADRIHAGLAMVLLRQPLAGSAAVMPKEFFMGYPSERGMGWSLPEALWRPLAAWVRCLGWISTLRCHHWLGTSPPAEFSSLFCSKAENPRLSLSPSVVSLRSFCSWKSCSQSNSSSPNFSCRM